MMERLTHRYKDGQAWVNLNYVSKMGENECVGLSITKLAAYEDAEEQGLLLRLPCKVGDTVYNIWNVDDKLEIQEIKIATLNNLVAHMEYGNFGKTVFLTRDEAEAKLKEMESD